MLEKTPSDPSGTTVSATKSEELLTTSSLLHFPRVVFSSDSSPPMRPRLARRYVVVSRPRHTYMIFSADLLRFFQQFQIQCEACTGPPANNKQLGTNCEIVSTSLNQCLFQHGAKKNLSFGKCDYTGQSKTMVSFSRVHHIHKLTRL